MKPENKHDIYGCVVAALRENFRDPTVELQLAAMPHCIRIRVNDGHGMPTYYRINVVKES